MNEKETLMMDGEPLQKHVVIALMQTPGITVTELHWFLELEATDISKKDLQRLLYQLRADGVVDRTKSDIGTRWRLSPDIVAKHIGGDEEKKNQLLYQAFDAIGEQSGLRLSKVWAETGQIQVESMIASFGLPLGEAAPGNRSWFCDGRMLAAAYLAAHAIEVIRRHPGSPEELRSGIIGDFLEMFSTALGNSGYDVSFTATERDQAQGFEDPDAEGDS